ncbi:DegT/DnrJ/EryC1/StrS family aminotransferase [Enterocloster clostridioformis]|uniref:DegT/DnrJ/EryC1/StrS family aminotransferase n=1 Tax=Enterocloster clostridioformis TaxID=1531 RepID=UPI0004120957|nr:DegT/DnrJ/EryC1/StrS family aminotransferase [Enterocloster clostridioformis]
MRKIPFSPPDVGADEINEIVKAVQSGWITTGPKTKLFEKKIADYCNVDKAVCLNSATACLESILRILGVGPGDEVITSAYTYTASASPVCHVGAKLVMVDVAKDSFEMDYDLLERSITDKTKVIIPVDLGGIMCDYHKIFDIVQRKKNKFCPSNKIQESIGRVIIVSDAAHAFGASRNGKMCGELSDFTSFSFHAVKNLTTAEGGALTWRHIKGVDDDWIYNQFMLLSLHGQSKDALAKTKLGSWEYDIVSPFYKCNMTDITAAMGLAQLARYDDMMKKRKEYIGMYDAAFKPLGIKVLKHYTKDYTSSGHLYMVRIPGIGCTVRNNIIIKLAERGIAANVHYKPLPMMSGYAAMGFEIKDYPNAYGVYENEITLPLHTCLEKEDVLYVIENMKEILDEIDRG